MKHIDLTQANYTQINRFEAISVKVYMLDMKLKQLKLAILLDRHPEMSQLLPYGSFKLASKSPSWCFFLFVVTIDKFSYPSPIDTCLANC